MNYKDALKFYPDFPIEGVNFVDVIPFLQDKDLLRGVARDLGVLCKNGYKVKKMQPVDMFPHTGHCEIVTLLAR